MDEAIACVKKAIELNPKFPGGHNSLGNALRDKGQVDEAIACHKKAIELDPKFPGAHFNLGNELRDKGQVDEAIACYRKAIELDPKYAVAHNNLGIALRQKGQLDEAIACFKKAIELNPKFAAAMAHLAQAERAVATGDKLPAYQSGSYAPDSNEERLGLAAWCQFKKLNHTAAGLCAAAFAANPKLADDLNVGHRYNAACLAALSAAGKGEDAAKLNDKERLRLRN